jgi:hypothetical protein
MFVQYGILILEIFRIYSKPNEAKTKECRARRQRRRARPDSESCGVWAGCRDIRWFMTEHCGSQDNDAEGDDIAPGGSQRINISSP